MTNFTDVGDFHEKFDLPFVDESDPSREEARPGPREINSAMLAFRRKFMQEELDEFIEGLEGYDHVRMADSLVDLVYVVMGTAHYLGYPWEALWDEVQIANLRKVRAKNADESKRNSEFDVVKPTDWAEPEIAAVLKGHGFDT